MPWLARPLGTAFPSTCGLHHCPEIHLPKNSKLVYLAASAVEVFSKWALYKLTYSFIHSSRNFLGRGSYCLSNAMHSIVQSIKSPECPLVHPSNI